MGSDSGLDVFQIPQHRKALFVSGNNKKLQMQKLFIIFFVLTCLSCSGQKTEKVIVFHEDPFDLYANFDKDSTTLFYEVIIPSAKPVGVLVILGGTYDLIPDIKKQITLHTLAAKKNLLIIFPSINYGTTKSFAEYHFLDTIFQQVVKKYKVPKDKFVIGGFSGGGMLALSYAERANKFKDSTYIVPKAVFGVDPPVDYAHLWDHCVNDIERNVSDMAVQESKAIMEEYIREFGGSPKEHPENYIEYSIYSHSEKDGGNAKYLINTPVLIYTEPDVMWQLKNRQRDFYDMNCLDQSAMINFLQLHANKNSELITTHNKGRRLDGRRHPHSWSIMDSQQCLNWIMKQLE